jgi:hypothetical protein
MPNENAPGRTILIGALALVVLVTLWPAAPAKTQTLPPNYDLTRSVRRLFPAADGGVVVCPPKSLPPAKIPCPGGTKSIMLQGAQGETRYIYVNGPGLGPANGIRFKGDAVYSVDGTELYCLTEISGTDAGIVVVASCGI